MAIATYKQTTKNTKTTPQTEPMLGEAQVENNAGGFVYEVGEWKQFERFLILGTEGGTFYVGEQKYTADNAKNAVKCILQDGKRAVDLIVAISDAGRAPKNTPAEFCLAMAASLGKDAATRSYALSQLPKVCRIPTHLYHFMAFVKDMRGFGRGIRRAMGNWFDSMTADKLAYEFVKYQSRDGWAGSDILRQAHPTINDPARNAVYRWMLGKDLGAMDVTRGRGKNAVTKHYGALPVALPGIIQGFEAAKKAGTAKEIIKLIEQYKLTREMLPTEALTYPDVWQALLDNGCIPYNALIRNLGNLSKHGIIAPMSAGTKQVIELLGNEQALRKARLHPLAILTALKVYAQGRGMKGSNTWTPVPRVVDALDDAFYAAFGNVTPTGKRLLFGVDVSGSMSSPFSGDSPLSSAECAGAMALICAKQEKDYHIFGFTHTFVDLGITPRMRLDSAVKAVQKSNFGSTDAAVPFVWALKNKVDVDAVIVITDNETWAGPQHVKQALSAYRKARVQNAKEVVIATAATQFTIADPSDPLTLDVVGFDTAVPAVISDFIRN